MQRLEKYKHIINKLPFDIRAEVLLAEMIINDVQTEEIEIATNSVFSRNVHFDIEKVEETEYVTTKRRRLRFVLNRDGLYDFLPEDLFHQPLDTTGNGDKEKQIQDMKTQQQRELAARKFFLPYEQEFFRLRIKLEMEEQRFMFANSGQMNTDVLARLWDLPDFLEEEQKLKLGLLMPVMHRLVGDKELCAFLASDITGDEVNLSETFETHTGFSEDPTLKDCKLGDDFVLGGEYQSMEPCNNWKINIKDVSQLSDYMPGGRKEKVHSFLSSLMLPLENDVNIELELSETTRAFSLSEEELSGVLGYETYI